MTEVAIRAEGLGKRYKIGEMQRYKALRDTLTKLVSGHLPRLFFFHRNTSRDGYKNERHIWALKDVSFEVRRAEVIGIIGRNGAGKTTLLKILSNIVHPTEGRAVVHGQVGSLLEVGTGFHPELTGRENVYLNGAMLGMPKAEIKRKFDEIVDFADVEKFIDTPVKRYSSGMYIRLAFAVAAHLEPDIMLVDEVLAVGDARFQRKCLNKMQDVSSEGRTVLFVSHNIPAVTRLCPRVILLDEGRVVQDGPSHQVVGAYLRSGLGTTAAREWPDPNRAPGNDVVRLCAVRVRAEDGSVMEAVDIRKPVGIEMEYDVLQPDHVLVPFLRLANEEGIYAFTSINLDPDWMNKKRPVGHYRSTAWIPGNLLTEGTLSVNTAVITANPHIIHFSEHDAVAFQVIDTIDGDSARGDFAGVLAGVVRPLLRWETCFDPNAESPQSRVRAND